MSTTKIVVIKQLFSKTYTIILYVSTFTDEITVYRYSNTYNIASPHIILCLHSFHYNPTVFSFLVSEAQAEIAGASEKYLMLNSPLHLECVVQQSPVDPVYIFWYHDSRMINYDIDRGVNVTSDLPNKHSALYIERASRAHSGNYTCAPSNAFPANTVIHILNGKYLHL